MGHVHDRTSQVLSYLGDHLAVGVVRPQESKGLRKVVRSTWVVSGEVRAVNGVPDKVFDLGNGHTFPVHEPSVEPEAQGFDEFRQAGNDVLHAHPYTEESGGKRLWSSKHGRSAAKSPDVHPSQTGSACQANQADTPFSDTPNPVRFRA